MRIGWSRPAPQRGHRQGRRAHQKEGDEQAGLELLLLPRAPEEGEHRAAAHAQAQQHRGEKGHQGEGRTYGGQRPGAQKPAYDQRVGYIVQLLKQIAQDQRPGEAEHGTGDASLRQIGVHSGLLLR